MNNLQDLAQLIQTLMTTSGSVPKRLRSSIRAMSMDPSYLRTFAQRSVHMDYIRHLSNGITEMSQMIPIRTPIRIAPSISEKNLSCP